MVFRYDPAIARAEFEMHGYACLKDILDSHFREYLRDVFDQVQECDTGEIKNWSIYGKKRQFLFEFPSQDEAMEFRNGIARLLGINADELTISERHLKIYDPSAEPWPAPHKDRAASEISIGLPVSLPEGSTVCVFPELKFGPNFEERAVFLIEEEHNNLKQVYQNERAVMLNEQVGDIVVFLGSSLFHERVKASGAAVLYIKANRSWSDPLGENIHF